MTTRERQVAVKLRIIADDEECALECPHLRKGYPAACALFPCGTIAERFHDFGGISHVRRPECIQNEAKP